MRLVDLMRMTNIPPSPALTGIVRRFTIVETAEEATCTLIPEAGFLLGFRYRGSSALLHGDCATPVANYSVTGMRDHARYMSTAAGSGALVVNFREGGAGILLRVPLDRLFTATVDLSEFISLEEIEQLSRDMESAHDDAARVAVVETLLLMRLRTPFSNAMVMAAIRAMRAARGAIVVRSMAKALGVSQDRLEKQFRRFVGATPKQYCSILRFRNALASANPQTRFTDIAVEAGYYDQSHFIREFRSVTGMTPRQFFRENMFC